MSTDFYCVKCRAHVAVDETKRVVTKNNKRMLKGECPECGTTVTKFYGMKEGKHGR
jgi:RNase P subunit RPR2